MRNRSESVQEITIKFYRHMFVFELYVLYLWKLPAPPRAALCYIFYVNIYIYIYLNLKNAHVDDQKNLRPIFFKSIVADCKR